MESMSTPKVSVVIPCYNVEKYLRQCLDSVVNQTLKELEIICVNDGSTDSTLDIIKEYAAKDPRVSYIDKPNAGYGDSMNKGFDQATGEYIGIIESDDYADLDMFEKLYTCAKEHDLDAVKAGFYYYYSKGEERNIPNPLLRPLPADVPSVL
jgi:glycosyltransferase involved in cell wall biosynthesis